jgi:hypothetical protein
VVDDAVQSVAFSQQQQQDATKRQDKDEQQPITLKMRPLYLSTISLTGAPTSVVLPQSTGDLLGVYLPTAGPALPASSTTARKDGGHKGRAMSLLEAAKSSSALPISKQRLYRHHNAHIVYAAPCRPDGAFLSVDVSGQVVLWPSEACAASGLGWVHPQEVYQLARAAKVPQLGGSVEVSGVQGTLLLRECGIWISQILASLP